MTVWGVFSDDVVAQGVRVMENGRPMYIEREYSDTPPKLMLMYAWSERLELHELVKKSNVTCREMKVDLLLIENKAAGISVAQELRRLYSREAYGVELFDPKNQDKMSRLYSVQHIFAEGMVYAPNRPWAERVITEVGQFPKGKHDDLTDTVSSGVRKLRDMGLLVRAEEHADDLEGQIVYPGADSRTKLYPC
jgi:predicted phage terminase large subunit-like protein